MKTEEITSEQLANALEKLDLLKTAEPGTCFVCEGMPVFLVDNDGELLQACTRATHGVHRRFEKANRVMSKLIAAIGPAVEKCPDCGGSGWFAYDDPNAVRNRILSGLCGIFRGIELPGHSKELTTGRLKDTLGHAFIDSLPSGSVTEPPIDPAGTGDPGRVVLFDKQ